MRVSKRTRPLVLVCLPLVVGCGQNAYTLQQGQVAVAQQQATQQRQQELQTRASSLDKDNQELEGLLAQSRQQIQLLRDELTAVRDQLRGSHRQLADLQSEKQRLDKHSAALAASTQRRAQATIKPNNSLVGELTVIHLPGVEVRQDGDVVRIELAEDKLFHPGSATLNPDAVRLMDGVMADVMRNYPDQMLGIEGHTDSDPVQSRQYPSHHHLSTAQAMAVYEHLTRRFQIAPAQMFVAGHGANHPVVSNATPAGKSRNRRVEVVVYPEAYR